MPKALEDNWLDDQLAAMLAPPDSRYIVTCRECRTVWTRQRDCKLTKGVRGGVMKCGDCKSELEFVLDAKDNDD